MRTGVFRNRKVRLRDRWTGVEAPNSITVDFPSALLGGPSRYHRARIARRFGVASQSACGCERVLPVIARWDGTESR